MMLENIIWACDHSPSKYIQETVQNFWKFTKEYFPELYLTNKMHKPFPMAYMPELDASPEQSLKHPYYY